jgi:hypothetical protein
LPRFQRRHVHDEEFDSGIRPNSTEHDSATVGRPLRITVPKRIMRQLSESRTVNPYFPQLFVLVERPALVTLEDQPLAIR